MCKDHKNSCCGQHHHDSHCGCHHHHDHHHHDHHHHGHEHHGHNHADGDNGVRVAVVRIVLSAVCLIAAALIEYFTDLSIWQLLALYLVPYLIAGYGTLREAVENICHGEVFDENFLMTLATIGALGIGFLPGAESQFPEAVFVMLFFQVGELFETVAEGRSRKSITQLMDLRSDTAHVQRGGEEITVPTENVAVGETVTVRPGEKIPLDGIVTGGTSNVNTVALTGESVPRSISVGSEVVSGFVNMGGVVSVRVSKPYGESTASKILELVENAAGSKSRSENFITRFARIYTPVVVLAALALAFVTPLFAAGSYMEALPVWGYRGLMFLVVSCPCALVISVPLTFFAGIGGASRQGILVKGANYLEALAKVGTVVFDKTGTLTSGVFSVTAVHPNMIDQTGLLHLAAHVERNSNHPIAASLREAYPDEADGCTIEQVHEEPGLGISAMVNGRKVCVGNGGMMDKAGADWHQCSRHGGATVIHVSIDGVYAGHILISDRIKDDSRQAISSLKAAGVRRTVMLTGDKETVAMHVAQQTGVDEYHAGMMPADKVNRVVELLGQKPAGTALAFVGDGINDAPVLARADVGIAMGALGSDAAIEAADVVLMDDKPSKVATAIVTARRTLRIARQNVVFSVGIKVLVLLLATLGWANMYMAVFADVGVTVLAVFNSMRAFFVRRD